MNDVEQKMAAAFDLLEEGNAEAALDLGRELEGLRHTSGFEIQALALAELDRMEEAIAVLERGVEKAPDVWLLWQLLGNDYSELGRYEEAIRAYERALECPGVDTFSVHFNFATVLSRQGRSVDALSHLDLAHAGYDGSNRELELMAASLRIHVLTELGRHEEALAFGRRLITKARVEVSLDDLMAPVLGAHALALWVGNRDREAAEGAAWEAIRLEKGQPAAMWVLRDMNPKASPGGSLYRIMLSGRWHEPFEEGGEIPGFYTTSWVIADSPDEAFALVSRFEPAEVRDFLTVEELEELEKRPGEPKGVYSVTGYSFYTATDAGEDEDPGL